MSKSIWFGRETFYPDFKPIYEIVRFEQDEIFIIPHVWDKERSVDVLIETYVFHICTGLNKSISHVRQGGYKLIFGFRNETGHEWKLAEYEFSHVGKGGGCICPSIYKYRFQEYQGEFPEESDVTGFPSSSLLDDKAFLEKYTY
jgi:hypothetical protein